MRLGFNVSKDSRIKLISGVESTLLSSLTERFHREVLVPNINYKVIDFIHKNVSKEIKL